MKPTAHFLALLFAALAVTALAADAPAQPALSSPNGPAVVDATPPAAATPPSEPVKAEPAAITTPALSSPAVNPSNPPNGPTTPPAPFSPLVNPQPEEKPADPDVLQLPKMVVKQKPRPRLTPEIMITRQGFGEELAKQKFSALDQALNKFTLPLFGTSMAERALDEHEREKRQQLNLDVLNMVKILEVTDPTEAKSLKETVRP